MDQVVVWNAVKMLMDRYGDGAAMEAVSRASAALETDDLFKYELWQHVINTLDELQWPSRSDGELN
jgi:hypothetical protein